MNEGAKTQSPRTQIDGLLNCIQADIDSVRGATLGIKRHLLGLEVPTPEKEAEKKEKIPSGWLNRIIRRLNDFGEQLRQIHQLENEILNAITEHPELKEMGEQLGTEQKNI